MKTMTKKLGAIILALAMCFSLTCVAFAADDDEFSITVENSIGGATYNAYKVFDATYNEDTGAVSYTIDSTNPWYNTVNAATDVFTLIETATTGTYQVTVNSGVSDSDVIAVFENAYTEEFAATLTAAATGTGNGGQITLDVGEAGYYFVTTTTGSVVSITTAAPTATIVDKNQKPGEGGEGKDLSKTATVDGNDVNEGSVSIGDEISYEISSYVPTYDGERKVTSYTIVDTMGEGLTLEAELGEAVVDSDTGITYYPVKDNVTVTITGTGITTPEPITDECSIYVSYDEEGETILYIYWEIQDILDDELVYPADAVVHISYTDEVNEKADETDITNAVAMNWIMIDPDDPDTPIPGGTDIPEEVDIYTFGFDLKKVDETGNALSGAQFTLSDSDGNLIYFDKTSVGYEVCSDQNELTTDGSTTITISNSTDYGDAIWGLAQGSYTLTETVAPDGYNLLANPVTITITETYDNDTEEPNGWVVTVFGVGAEATTSNGTFGSDEHGVGTMPLITITNNAGSELPGTGGIGTTIFYVIGGVLVAGAVVVLITRRRMNSAD